ncbi:hypothetical protein B9Q08_00035 [Candidatus Marsarchaeota G2 archaeon ECH_B_SAG-M15]|uniref:Probable transposase IS891/IS1136/IS1341 domain-containing protein n=1 Tax=Candidatus Marsarchaeota G2 archaeon ECH_B_SAG-M15 TaxID=1978162 RepID=A0A2R6B2T7_9ARCH|nr:MAG: hypothetical protein B9Q08_00035 [Candidatus Marsarchaeota G2 archaeon ECH_B_SAG-M15]
MKKSHRFLSLVYPQSGWRLSNAREVGLGRNKKRRAQLYLSKIGFFTLILHRVFPENQVSQVCVKLYPSGQIHVIFLVEEAEVEEELSSGEGEPVKAVGVDLGLARLAALSDGRFLENPKPLERSLERIRVLQRTLSRKSFSRVTGLKRGGGLLNSTSVGGISGVTCSSSSGLSSQGSTMCWCQRIWMSRA